MLSTREWETADQVYLDGAQRIFDVIERNPRAHILTGCGSTITQINHALVAMLKAWGKDLSDLRFVLQDEQGICCKDSLPEGDERRFRTVTESTFAPLAPLGLDSRKNFLWPDDAYPADTIFQAGHELPEWEGLIAREGKLDGALIVPGKFLHMAYCETGFAPPEQWLARSAFATEIPWFTRVQNKDYPGCNGDPNRHPTFALTLAPGSLLRLLNIDATAVFSLRGDYNRENVVDMFDAETGPRRPATIYRVLSRMGWNVVFNYDACAASDCRNY